MENMKHQSSSSSFTETLFGPKDGRTSSTGLFGSVFGPSSTGVRHTGSSNKQDFGNSNHSTTDCKTQGMKCENRRNSSYQTESAEPSYYSSSIYYGGQDIYPPTSTNNCSQRTFKRGGGDEDPNGNSASRGNWWQGSLYY
ncbi:uncharacterized protein LOC143626022 [Bidens hawaiensis]|uniref:uncharacterized protein LOC143626022 n=1 Tax=Bidens hawaiensis TaxID=980011 RepID=UPI00404B305B